MRTTGPVPRAAAITALTVPFLAAAQGAILTRAGHVLDAHEFVMTVLAPIAVTATAVGMIFGLVLGEHAILLRKAMSALVEGDFTAGLAEPRLDIADDILGVRETFVRMRGELDRAIRQMAHADAQRRRLFADLAHELATPASALLALGDTLSDPSLALAEDARARLFRAIEGETLRVARLVEDIRDLAALDDPDVSFDLSRTDLAAPVHAAVERFGASKGARIEIEAREVPASIDAHRIDQAVTNLLKNARRATPEDRTIRVTVGRDGESGVIVVEDEGAGVPEEALERLGERLYRVDPGRDRARGGGHGLGLSIVRAILERHGGSVSFEAAPAGGLRVTLRVPALEASPS